MSLTSREVNYLIWRYLQESGHDLSAYALDKETHCHDYESDKNEAITERIEPGCLVNLIQKGILYSLAEREARGDKLKDSNYTLLGFLLEEQVDKIKREQSAEDKIDNMSDRFRVKSETEDKTEKKDDDLNNEDSSLKQDSTLIETQAPFSTRFIETKIKFSESLVSRWHPAIDVFAYGKSDSNAVINVLMNDKITESVVLNHPPALTTTTSTKPNEILCVSWAPNGSIFITAASNGELRAWSPDGMLKNIAHATSVLGDRDESKGYLPDAILKLMWNPSGTFLISIDVSNQICLWNSVTLAPIHKISSCDISLDKTLSDAAWLDDVKFAVPTANNSIKIYSIVQRSGTQDFSLHGLNIEIKALGTLSGHARSISMMRYNDSLKLLASSSDFDYVIKVWQSGSSHELYLLNDQSEVDQPDALYHKAPFVGLFWLSSLGNFLLSVSMDGVLKIWDVTNGKPKVTTNLLHDLRNYSFDEDFNIHNKAEHEELMIFSSASSPNSKYLAIADNYGRVMIYDVDVLKSPSSCRNVKCVAFFNFTIPENYNADKGVGVCDMDWNKDSSKLSVCYQGADSSVFDLSDL